MASSKIYVSKESILYVFWPGKFRLVWNDPHSIQLEIIKLVISITYILLRKAKRSFSNVSRRYEKFEWNIIKEKPMVVRFYDQCWIMCTIVTSICCERKMGLEYTEWNDKVTLREELRHDDNISCKVWTVMTRKWLYYNRWNFSKTFICFLNCLKDYPRLLNSSQAEV